MVSPRPLSKKAIVFLSSTIDQCGKILPFSEGDWGNRSLGPKERFPQKTSTKKEPFSG